MSDRQQLNISNRVHGIQGDYDYVVIQNEESTPSPSKGCEVVVSPHSKHSSIVQRDLQIASALISSMSMLHDQNNG